MLIYQNKIDTKYFLVLFWSLTFFFSTSTKTFGRGPGESLGLGMRLDGYLIICIGLDLGGHIGMSVRMDAEGVVNIFSGSCLDIFS